MQSVRIRLEVITPMFMAGANSKTPELRAPSIKGMMRFWWRAVKGIDDPKELRKEEEKIFGGTEGAGKSKVNLKFPQIKSLDSYVKEGLKENFNLECRFKKGKLEGKHTGLCYLLYSVDLPKNKRKFIMPKYPFELTLCSRDDTAFKQALASLWCAIHLGGFGVRARRGGGNLSVVGIEDDAINNYLDFSPKGSTPDEVASWLCENYKKVREAISGKEGPKKFIASYSNLSFSRLIISRNPGDSWVGALNSVGKLFEEFRAKHRGEIFDSAVFGLPVRHRNITVKAKKEEEFIKRRSSPLIFKLLMVEGEYYWMILRLSGEFLPEGAAVTDGGKSSSPDYKLIDEFWTELKKQGKEFILSKPQILETMVQKIKTQINPTKIILFGSRARGDGHKRADIDIAVETNKSLGLLDVVAPAVDIVNLKSVNDKLKEKIKREGIEVQ